MTESREELASGFPARQAARLVQLGARHPRAVDLTVCLVIAAASVIGLVVQHQLSPVTLAFCAGLCAPLLVHRRSAIASFGAIAAVAVTQWLTSGPQLADAALLVAFYWVALESSLAELGVAAATLELGAALAALRWSEEPLKIWIGLSGLAAASGGLGVTIRQRRALLLSLGERAARLEFERDQEGRLGAAAERARIARETHDIVAHNVSVMIALADGASYTMDTNPGRAAQAVRRISMTGREALVEMRRLLGVLRDESASQPLEPQPGLGQLDDLLGRVQAAGVAVTLELSGSPDALTEGVQLAVYRVAQEALTNTLKHAKRPTSAHLALSFEPGLVELEVTNTGRPVPFDASPPYNGAGGGRGLRGMRERASAYGGHLEVGPRPQGGWRVWLELRPGTKTGAPARAEAAPQAPDPHPVASLGSRILRPETVEPQTVESQTVEPRIVEPETVPGGSLLR
jgi:signal transduction histidine kinase